jgi:hypothetical protein
VGGGRSSGVVISWTEEGEYDQYGFGVEGGRSFEVAILRVEGEDLSKGLFCGGSRILSVPRILKIRVSTDVIINL